MTLTIFEIEKQFNKIIIAYKPELRKVGVARTVTGCLLASQLFYIRKTNGDKPICIPDKEMAKTIGLSVRELKNARKDIIETGAFTYTLGGLPRKGFYDINPGFKSRNLEEADEPAREGEAPEPPLQQGLAIGTQRASSRDSEGSQSICIESSLREEATPAPKRTKKQERISTKVIEVYNAGKPEAWPGKNKISKATLDLIEHWVGELGEEDFIDHLTKALAYTRGDEWWSKNVLSLESLLRKTKTHLVEMAEKQTVKETKPHLARGYSSSASRPGPKLKKQTEFAYPKDDSFEDLF